MGDNRFAPEEMISRQDMFVALYNVLSVLEVTLETAGTQRPIVSDDAAEIADYARAAVDALSAADIVSGSGGKVNPQALSRRWEAAQLPYGLISMVREETQAEEALKSADAAPGAEFGTSELLNPEAEPDADAA